MATFHFVTLPAMHAEPRLTGIQKAFALLFDWRTRSRQRLELLKLDDRMLHDIGLTRADVHREAQKHFWRA